jgi:hypothetical protein
LVYERLNCLTPTKKPVRFGCDRNGRRIADLQALLLKLAKDKTEQLYPASIPTARGTITVTRAFLWPGRSARSRGKPTPVKVDLIGPPAAEEPLFTDALAALNFSVGE